MMLEENMPRSRDYISTKDADSNLQFLNFNDMECIIETLRRKRTVFHSEADFQFALAWEIQRKYPEAEIRLEYPPMGDPNKYIDILVRKDKCSFPIELKYKTKKLHISFDNEQYNLKNHGAQDLGCYDFVKDICRIESFSTHLDGFKCGYALWLTNDQKYWNAPNNLNAGYVAFSVHHGAKKTGLMKWANHLSSGTIKGREEALSLHEEYEIVWKNYSDLGKNGAFKYALIPITM
jgi:hypothetical protein